MESEIASGVAKLHNARAIQAEKMIWLRNEPRRGLERALGGYEAVEYQLPTRTARPRMAAKTPSRLTVALPITLQTPV
jgi:hypothetical protein